MGYRSDEIMMHIIATSHIERQIREQIEERGPLTPQFDFSCKCGACQFIYQDRMLMEAIVRSICKNLYKEMQGNN